MIEQPVVDEGGDLSRTKAVLGDGLDSMALQAGESGIEPVADPGLDQAAESPDGIEFRAVGRQAEVVGRKMKAGLILDDHVQGVEVAYGDLAQEKRVGVMIDGGGEEQFGGVVAVHFHRLVQVPPLVFGGIGRVDAHPARAPDAAYDRQKPVTVSSSTQMRTWRASDPPASSRRPPQLRPRWVRLGLVFFAWLLRERIQLAPQAVATPSTPRSRSAACGCDWRSVPVRP